MRTRIISWVAADRRGLLVWVAVVILIAILGVGSLTLIREVERGPRPPFLGVETSVVAEAPKRPREATRLHLAGSGSNLPLTRALATGFAADVPGMRVVVHESIGSSGGIRAAYDGAIDLGLVSRELEEDERELGLQTIPYARVAVVFAAHPTVPVDDLSRRDVLDLYSGARRAWADGTDVVVFQREIGDSAHVIAAQAIAGFAEVDTAAATSRRWRILYYDRDMQDSLLATEGAIGLFDLGGVAAQDLPLRVMSLDGVGPTESNIVAGRYPLHKPLAFVTRGNHGELADRFIAFVRSPRGQTIIRESGYIPFTDQDQATGKDAPR